MAEKLYHLVNGEFVLCGMPSVHIPTYAEIGAHIAILNDVGFFDDRIVAESVTFDGLSNGKRTTEKQASVYDAMMAEMIDERNAEKARVRNRRRSDRKHKLTPKMRKEQELMRKDRMYGYAWNLDCPKVRFAPDSEPIKTRKYAEGDRINREDWDTELSVLTEEIECAEFMLDSDLDDLAWLKNEIFEIGNPEGTIALYEERIKELRKESERKAKLEQYKVDTEKRIRNGKEYMRKNQHIKEMI